MILYGGDTTGAELLAQIEALQAEIVRLRAALARAERTIYDYQHEESYP